MEYKLIEQIKYYPIVYDNKHEDFRNRVKKLDAWKDIADALGIRDAVDIDAEKLLFLIEAKTAIYNYEDIDHSNKIVIDRSKMNCQVSKCKNKWTSLRNAYARYVREETFKPSRSIRRQKKKWYLADAMSFLKDFLISQHRNSTSSLDSPNKQEAVDDLLEADSPDTFTESTLSPVTTPVPKRSRRSMSEMIAGLEFLKSKTKPKESENANELFFKTMLADFEKLSSKRQRTFKLHMLSKMNDLQEEDENEGLNTSTAAGAVDAFKSSF